MFKQFQTVSAVSSRRFNICRKLVLADNLVASRDPIAYNITTGI